MKAEIATNKAPSAIGPYSQGIEAQGKMIFVSGQLPVNRETGEFEGEDITSQTERAISNLKAVLEQAGASLDNVVKTTVFLSDMNDFCGMNAVYEKMFGAPYPARSAVEVARVPKSAKLEIEAIAVV